MISETYSNCTIVTFKLTEHAYKLKTILVLSEEDYNYMYI